MALQDLTPQLRTRLNRVERAVGWFVLIAAALLVFGFAYYLRNTAKRKGWFVAKASYYTFTDRATGIKVGDPVTLMGFEIGQITRIDTMDPWSPYNVYVEFQIREPYNGYLWTGHNGSRAKVVTVDLLGKRALEVTKGTDGYPAYRFHPLRTVTLVEAETARDAGHWQLAAEFDDATGSNVALRALSPLTKETLAKLRELGVQQFTVLETNELRKFPTAVWIDQTAYYTNYIPKPHPAANIYGLPADETPAVTDRIENILAQVEVALPNVLGLTNQIARVLTQSTQLASNLNVVALDAQPVAANLASLSAQLREPGSLGEWVLGTNGQRQLETTLASANSAITSANSAISHADTNLIALMENLARSLDNLAGITSNLNAQVQANTNILSSISSAVVDVDELVQGLKRHWLLRSAFKSRATNAPPAQRLTPPRDSNQR